MEVAAIREPKVERWPSPTAWNDARTVPAPEGTTTMCQNMADSEAYSRYGLPGEGLLLCRILTTELLLLPGNDLSGNDLCQSVRDSVYNLGLE